MEPGKQRIYSKAFEGRTNVVKWDVREIEDKQTIKITFISKNLAKRQGVRLATDHGIEVNGRLYPAIQLWKDTAPNEISCICHTSDGLLSIYNVYDKGRGSESMSHTSGMIIEESNSGTSFIYRCNDIGFKTSFDKLIFKLQKS